MPTEQYEVEVTVGDAEIEVRGAQEGVVEIVRALSEILAGRPRQTAASESAVAAVQPTARTSQVDARSFFSEKGCHGSFSPVAHSRYVGNSPLIRRSAAWVSRSASSVAPNNRSAARATTSSRASASSRGTPRSYPPPLLMATYMIRAPW
jgi:hypothetical protein